MSSSSPLETHRTMLQQHVLPAYERLGSLTLVYPLGSLVSGYTQDADLDIRKYASAVAWSQRDDTRRDSDSNVAAMNAEYFHRSCCCLPMKRVSKHSSR